MVLVFERIRDEKRVLEEGIGHFLKDPWPSYTEHSKEKSQSWTLRSGWEKGWKQLSHPPLVTRPA